MTGYHVVHSIRLHDSEGSTLDILLESNDKAWKLFGRYRLLGNGPQESDWRVFPTEELGVKHYHEQVADAESQGWER